MIRCCQLTAFSSRNSVKEVRVKSINVNNHDAVLVFSCLTCITETLAIKTMVLPGSNNKMQEFHPTPVTRDEFQKCKQAIPHDYYVNAIDVHLYIKFF